MKKRKVIFCAAEPYNQGIVPERYDLSTSYAYEYLVSYAEADRDVSAAYEFEIMNFKYDMLDEDAIFAIAMKKPYMVGFSCSVKNFERNMNIARQVKLARPEVKIIIGGPEAFAAERIMKSRQYIDYAVIGEGEKTFADLLKHSDNSRKRENIKGLAFRNEKGITINPQSEAIENIDSIPSIFNKKKADSLSGIVLYETSRGCTHSCTYCVWSPYRKRSFSMIRIKKELSLLLKNENISRIWFIDSDFDSDAERAKEILRFAEKHKGEGVQFAGFLDFDYADDELMELVARLFFEAPIGLQSVKPEVLRACGRSWFSVKKFEKTIDRLLEKISPDVLYIDIMYGLPKDNYDGFIETLMWCIERGLTHINFFRTGIYPGTALERNSKKYGYVYDPEPPHLVYSSNTFSYSDIVRIENAIVNYSVLLAVVGNEGIRTLKDKANLPAILDGLNGCTPDYEKHFKYVNESNISDIDANTLKPFVLKYLKTNVRNKLTL